MNFYMKNIFRTVLKNKGSYLGAIFVIGLGILIYVSMSNMVTILEQTVNNYYKQYNFADVFSTVESMYKDDLAKLENIDGIKRADGKLSTDARLMLTDSNDIITLHIMDNESDLNKPIVSTNILNNNEILIGNKMFETYAFNIGDKIDIIVDGKLQTVTIVGTAQAPDYVLAIPPSGAMPDSRIYDIAYMNRENLEVILDKKNKVNELAFLLDDGYSFNDIKFKLEQNLKDYGLKNLIESKNQPSNNIVQNQILTFVSIATTLPTLFLAVSVFMLYIILKKIIDQDRSLIGTIKAFGFKDSEIIISYIFQGIVTGILGAVLGNILSIPFSKYLFNMIISVYNIPNNDFEFYLENTIISIIIAIIATTLAVYFSIKEIIKINPSESMRAISPNFSTNFNIPRVLKMALNSKQMIGLRAIFRNKFRSLVIALCIGFPFGLTASLSAFTTIQKEIMTSQFTKVQTYDLKVNLNSYVKYNDAISSLQNLSDIYNIEAIAEYSINIKYKNRTEYSTLVGLNTNSQIYRIMDTKGRYYQPPQNGLIVNSAIAKKLNLKQGDIVEIENTSFKSIKIPIINIIEESSNSGVYIDINSINKYFNTDKVANSIIFNTYSNKLQSIKNILLSSKNIASVVDKDIALTGFNQNMQSNAAIIGILKILSVIAGIVLIYNILNISLRERKNEFGTMSILGLKSSEISEAIVFEQIINFIMGIFIGTIISNLVKKLLEAIMEAGALTMTVAIDLNSYLKSLIICLIIMVVSLIAVLTKLRNIELTDILKER